MEITSREELAAQAEALAIEIGELESRFAYVALMRTELEMARERLVDALLMDNLLAYGDGEAATDRAREIETEALDDVMPFYEACLHFKWAIHLVEPEEVDDNTFTIDHDGTS